jgi:23S rRNA (guanosine2251-2'-O)-methyltransferase
MAKIYLIIHDVRSAHNVGSLLRSADGFGVAKVYLTGYSPYPLSPNDDRLPHESQQIHKRIQKTALGAENTVSWEKRSDLQQLIIDLKGQSVKIVALEQSAAATNLTNYKSKSDIAVIVGSELTGLPDNVLAICDEVLEIPMIGQKESFNVAVAGAIGLFQLRYRG